MAVRYTQVLLIALALIISGGLIMTAATFAQAQERNPFDDIVYPIAELGGCESERACHAYCDDTAHINECVDFAESHGLMSAEEAQHARSFARVGEEGPGGCRGRDECEAYCEDTSHVRECLAFAEEHDLMNEDELHDAQRIAEALEQGAELPGGCTNKRECEAYCMQPGHMRECVVFAEKAGFAEAGEIEEMKKIATYIESGGQMPGGCQNERECEAYCMEDAHIDECTEFAIGAGFMSEEEAEMFRKTGGRGPGGCRGRECETYCDDPAHRQQCVQFAMDHDLLSEGDRRQMEEGMARAREAIAEAPPEVLKCIEGELGAGAVDELRAGGFVHGPRMGEVMQRCFNEHFGSFDNQNIPPEVGRCLREMYGPDVEERLRSGELDASSFDEAALQQCANQHAQRGGREDAGIPDEARSCLHEIYGENFEERMRAGDLDPRTFGDDMRRCMEQYHTNEQFDENGGRPPEDFRRESFEERRGDFPPDEFRPERLNRHPDDFEGRQPPEDFRPDDFEEFAPEQFKEQFRQEYEDRYQEQFDAERERMEAQYHDQFEGDMPPPPDEYFYEPPPEDTTHEDTSSDDSTRDGSIDDDAANAANPFLANVLTIFAQLLGR